MGASPGPVTVFLNRVKRREQNAVVRLAPPVYNERQLFAGVSGLAPQQARIAETRYFGALLVNEAAEVHSVNAQLSGGPPE
jgi:hypothetical protein